MSEISEKVWTVLELLRWTKEFFAERGIDTARLDAELLLAHALGTKRLQLYVDFEKPVSAGERAAFRALVKRRSDERVPVAYLTGSREFWSLGLAVSPKVLIPRPETETLVEAVIAATPTEAELRILDIGTGSGAIALALASERPKAHVTATDLSPDAIEVATANAEALGLADRVRFLAGDAFEPVLGERFDVVASNPPYLADAEAAGLEPELRHEPREALFAGGGGTELLARIVADAGTHLEPGGLLALEMAPGQVNDVTQWLCAGGFVGVRAHRDLAGRERVVSARTPDKE